MTWINSPGKRSQTWARMHVSSEYEAMLNGTPRPMSADRWYICGERSRCAWLYTHTHRHRERERERERGRRT